MADEEQTEPDRQRVDGERDRDGERREVIALRVEGPQRRGDRREGHRDRERERHDPETGVAALPLSALCEIAVGHCVI